MTTSFAAKEARINAAALACFANATATIGGAAIDVIFKSGYAEALGYIGGSSPQIQCASSDVSSVTAGSSISIGGVNYTVAEIHHDGTGITVIKLEAV